MRTFIIELLILFLFISTQDNCRAQEAELSKELRNNSVVKTAEILKSRYAIPEIGKKYSQLLLENLGDGKYDDIRDCRKLAKTLSDDLVAIHPDSHLGIRYNPNINSEVSDNQTQEEKETADDDNRNAIIQNEEARNYGFTEVKILPGNIGYIRLNEFPSERSAETIKSAMGFVQYANDIIVDIRENEGGNPEIVSYIGSYFFTGDEPTQFSSIYIRPFDETIQFRTALHVPGKRMLDAGLYILVSSKTFSAAESFAYDLQKHNRATIVGETTAGGAHIANPYRVNDFFVIDLPFARAINPVTNSNWEGTGVIPDIKCPANEALNRVYSVILDSIIANNPNRSTLNNLGYSLIRNNNFEQAAEVFKRNTDLHPGYANGFDSLGEAYMLLGEKELAIEAYKRSLELDPDNENAERMIKRIENRP